MCLRERGSGVIALDICLWYRKQTAGQYAREEVT